MTAYLGVLCILEPRILHVRAEIPIGRIPLGIDAARSGRRLQLRSRLADATGGGGLPAALGIPITRGDNNLRESISSSC